MQYPQVAHRAASRLGQVARGLGSLDGRHGLTRMAITAPRLCAQRWQSTSTRDNASRSTSPALLGGVLLAFGAGLAVSYSGFLDGVFPRAKSSSPLAPAPIQYADQNSMIKAAHEIAAALGTDAVSFDEDEIENYGHSELSSTNSTGRALAIVCPKSTEEVSKVAAICSRYNVPIVAFGAGSSIEGNFASPYGGIVVNFAYMDKVLAFRPDDMDVVVQPGVNWVDLNRLTQEEGLFLPLDPSPTATIGGMVSTNCSGTNAFRYGTMKDWVINVTVVLADGQVIKTRRRPRKTSAGYNLTSLFVGAEGTLGLVTEITLKLAVVPRETSVVVVSFPTIADAVRAATRIIRSGVQLAAMELMDEVQIRVLNQHGSEAVRRTRWDETATLFLRFSGPTAEGVKADVARIKELVEPSRPTRYFAARTRQEETDLWTARKEALWTMTCIKPQGYSIWSTDVAVPISRLAEIIELSKRDGEALGLFTSVVGHVGDGNFHEALMYDPKNAQHRADVRETVNRMIQRALEMDGTVSGEHAIGMGKMECLVHELGTDAIALMRSLKGALDPKWLLNPGKIFSLPEGSVAKAAETREG